MNILAEQLIKTWGVLFKESVDYPKRRKKFGEKNNFFSVKFWNELTIDNIRKHDTRITFFLQ